MMNMNAYYYGRNIDVQNALAEDGFNDGMVNYIHENEAGKASHTARKNSFFHTLFGFGRKTPAYQG